MEQPTGIKRVLIVDSEPTIQTLITGRLKTAGVELTATSSMVYAEKELARCRIDLVIADIGLSGMLGIVGLELLTYIKAVNPGAQIIVIAESGPRSLREEAVMRGAFWFYERPVDMEDLLEKMRELGITVSGNNRQIA